MSEMELDEYEQEILSALSKQHAEKIYPLLATLRKLNSTICKLEELSSMNNANENIVLKLKCRMKKAYQNGTGKLCELIFNLTGKVLKFDQLSYRPHINVTLPLTRLSPSCYPNGRSQVIKLINRFINKHGQTCIPDVSEVNEIIVQVMKDQPEEDKELIMLLSTELVEDITKALSSKKKYYFKNQFFEQFLSASQREDPALTDPILESALRKNKELWISRDHIKQEFLKTYAQNSEDGEFLTEHIIQGNNGEDASLNEATDAGKTNVEDGYVNNHDEVVVNAAQDIDNEKKNFVPNQLQKDESMKIEDKVVVTCGKNETTNVQNETTNVQNETTKVQNETTKVKNETTNVQNETIPPVYTIIDDDEDEISIVFEGPGDKRISTECNDDSNGTSESSSKRQRHY